MHYLITLYLCTLLCSYVASHTFTFYVNASSPATFNCGSQLKPCKTLEFAWDGCLRSRIYVNGTDLYGDIIFLMAPGFYDQRRPYEALTFACTDINVNITSITIKADFSSGGGRVQIQDGLSINYCQNITFENIEFINVKQSITLTNIHFASFTNIIVKKNIHKPIINIQNSGDVVFKNIAIRQNEIRTGADIPEKESFAFQFYLINELNMTDLHIEGNTNLKFLFRFVKYIYNKNFTAIKNDNFSIVYAGDTTVHATMFDFSQNYGNKENHGFIQLWYNTNVTFREFQVTCNKYEQTKYGSIFTKHDNCQLECIDCKALKCPVYCGVGQGQDGILCTKCPPGSSAHIWEKKCKKCEIGYYSALSGSVDCIACSKGTYCNGKGCTFCKQCKNDFFTSGKGSGSCSRMSTLFIILLGCVILLTCTPLLICAIKKSRQKQRQQIPKTDVDFDDDDDDNNDDVNDNQDLETEYMINGPDQTTSSNEPLID